MQSPRAPAVDVPATRSKAQPEPSDAGWDAPTAAALPGADPEPVRVVAAVEKTATAPKPMSVPPRPRMASTPPPPDVRVATPSAVEHGLSASMRDEVWAIVRAAVEEGMRPLVTRQRELEARLAAAESAVREAQARPAPPAASVQIASIPVALGPPDVPDVPPAPKAPSIERPRRAGSIPPTGFGVAVVRAPSPEIDLAAIAKIPVEMEGGFDGGRRQRALRRIIVGLLLAGVLVAIVMAILSQHGGL